MLTEEVLEGLFFIQRGYLNGNHFACRCAAPVLVDTGYVADFADTRAAIGQVGVDPADVALIIGTHTHCDHVGGNHGIQQLSGCDIALHKVGKHFIDRRDDWATWWRYYDQEADFFDCTLSLEDGQEVEIGPHRFEVLHTPGHAADGIVLYHRGEKVLLSSDTLWESDTAVITLRVEGSTALLQMQNSLERIARLAVERVYPGHGRPFSDFGSALEKGRQRIARYVADPTALGDDLLKKITVYTLLMKKRIPEQGFLEHLMGTYWFRETVDLYFNGEYRLKYVETLERLLARGIVERADGALRTTVKP